MNDRVKPATCCYSRFTSMCPFMRKSTSWSTYSPSLKRRCRQLAINIFPTWSNSPAVPRATLFSCPCCAVCPWEHLREYGKEGRTSRGWDLIQEDSVSYLEDSEKISLARPAHVTLADYSIRSRSSFEDSDSYFQARDTISCSNRDMPKFWAI